MTNGKDMRPGPNPAEEEGQIDKVLRLASDPALPDGAMARLMARVAVEEQENKLVPLVHRAAPPPRRSVFRLAAALPLAASLALGIYLGAKGTLDFMMPSLITGGVAMGDEVTDELGGVGEADAYAAENLS